MTTFAELVYREVVDAPPGATRYLDDVLYTKVVDWTDEERWVSEEREDALRNVAMWEATVF